MATPGMQQMQMNVHDYAQKRLDAANGRDNNFASRVSSRFKYTFQRRSVIYATIATIVLILIISVSVSVTSKKRNQSLNGLTTFGPRYPKPEVNGEKLQQQKNILATSLVDLYNGLDIPWQNLNNENSPQYHALRWVAGRKEFNDYSPSQRIQRFALATFYYSTFMVEHDFWTSPTDWASQEEWVYDVNECEWEGIGCNSDNQVISIILQENELSGNLPMELAFLPQLQELDLTTNYVFMEDEMHDLWLNLPKLKKLLMEDNFVVTKYGLPAQFIGMKSLEKINLSYNLLQGQLEGGLFANGNLQRLEHLEVESNYLSGDIPAEVGQLPFLIYFYGRRNLFSIKLPEMIVNASYPSIFSLWLDNNNVTGSIPTYIGQLQGLASFSITNATLTGSVPSEMGQLVGLKRVWLYENKLEGTLPAELNNLGMLEVFEVHANNLVGTMPETICNAVAGSRYQYRALTADCDQVTCTNCCTVCYEG